VPAPAVVGAVQGTLALDLVPAAPPAPTAGVPVCLLEPDATACDPTGLPDPRRWATMLAQAVVEILARRRPVAQVLRWLEPAVYERVRRSVEAGRDGRGGAPVRVRRVRVGTTPDGNVEAVAVVDDGVRCRALALRLEPLDGRWLCTSLDVV
jgi:hypothetical protein